MVMCDVGVLSWNEKKESGINKQEEERRAKRNGEREGGNVKGMAKRREREIGGGYGKREGAAKAGKIIRHEWPSKAILAPPFRFIPSISSRKNHAPQSYLCFTGSER